MEKMTAKQILEEVEQNYSVYEFGYSEIKNPLPNVGKWEEVEQYGGEGEGDTWYSVKYFIEHDVYIRTDGFYQSHDGVYFWDGYGEEVFPKEKTITVYEP